MTWVFACVVPVGSATTERLSGIDLLVFSVAFLLAMLAFWCFFNLDRDEEDDE